MNKRTRGWTRVLLITLLLLLTVTCARGEGLGESMEKTLDGLDLSALEDMLKELGEPFAGQGLKETLLSVARGETTVSAESLVQTVAQRFLTELTRSLWRVTRLIVPALLLGVCGTFGGQEKAGKIGSYLCFLLVAVFLVQDLTEHAAAAEKTIRRMSEGMQGMFPLLLTLLSAVGGSTGAAIFQPAVAAAAGSMTTLITSVTLPLAKGTAIVTMVDHLLDHRRFQRLASLLYTAATWTLGICFTVFIAAILTSGMNAAAMDGVTIRTAKYALDNFVPVVGGLFADTVDTLVGGSLLIQNALGTAGLLLVLGLSLTPLCQTLGTVALYHAAAALLEPVGDERVVSCITAFAKVLMLLFILELCAAAMFILLIAQILAMSNLTVMMR